MTVVQIRDYRKDKGPDPEITWCRFRGRRSFGGRTFAAGTGVWHVFQMRGTEISATARCGKAWSMDAEMTTIKPAGKICVRCQRFSPVVK